MTNPYIEYYSNQAGSGLAGFEGYRYQRGHGFFSSIFQNILKPLGRYLGRTALSTGVNIGNDFLHGENIKDSLNKNVKLTSKNMLGDAITRAQKFAQTGSGKRRRRRKKTVIKPKIKKKVSKKTKTVRKKKSTSTVKKRTSKKRALKSKFSHLF